MEKPSPIFTFFAILGTIVNLYATAVAQGINDAITRDTADFNEAVGNAFGYIILLIFWWGFAAVAFLLLLIGLLFKQHMPIVLINALACVAQWYWVATPIIDTFTGTTVELLQTLFLAFLPLVLISIMSFFGFINMNKD